MPEPKLTFIPDIVEEHFEELEFLWGQRLEALGSPEYFPHEVAELEQRIEAHVQGLLVPGEAMIEFVEEGLAEDDPLIAFAAGYALLRLDNPTAIDKVVTAFLAAEGDCLEGLKQALCQAPVDAVTKRLTEAVNSESAPVAAAAAEVLAFHGRRDPHAARLTEFRSDEDPQVRRCAWRTTAILHSTGRL